MAEILNRKVEVCGDVSLPGNSQGAPRKVSCGRLAVPSSVATTVPPNGCGRLQANNAFSFPSSASPFGKPQDQHYSFTLLGARSRKDPQPRLESDGLREPLSVWLKQGPGHIPGIAAGDDTFILASSLVTDA